MTGDGRIQVRFGGRVIGIDVGMSEVYGGHLAALEVGADGSLTALYPDRQRRARSGRCEGGPRRPASPARALSAYSQRLPANDLRGPD